VSGVTKGYANAEGRASRTGAAGLDPFRNPTFRLQAMGNPIDSRHPWRSRYAPPSAFAFAIPGSSPGQALQTQSGSIAGMRRWPRDGHRKKNDRCLDGPE